MSELSKIKAIFKNSAAGAVGGKDVSSAALKIDKNYNLNWKKIAKILGKVTVEEKKKSLRMGIYGRNKAMPNYSDYYKSKKSAKGKLDKKIDYTGKLLSSLLLKKTEVIDNGKEFIVTASVGFDAIYLNGLHAFQMINILASNGYYVRGIDDRARKVIFSRMQKQMRLIHGGIKK